MWYGFLETAICSKRHKWSFFNTCLLDYLFLRHQFSGRYSAHMAKLTMSILKVGAYDRYTGHFSINKWVALESIQLHRIRHYNYLCYNRNTSIRFERRTNKPKFIWLDKITLLGTAYKALLSCSLLNYTKTSSMFNANGSNLRERTNYIKNKKIPQTVKPVQYSQYIYKVFLTQHKLLTQQKY